MPGSAEDGCHVSPVFGVRVAGMPVGDLEALRFVRTWSVIDELLDTSAAVAREGEALSEALHDVIGANAGSDLKPLLVALRRALFRGRRPQPRTRSPEVLNALPDDLAQRITAWLRELERRDVLLAGLPGVLAGERHEKTERLREIVSADAFRHGLAQSSPVLSAELDKWLAGQAQVVPGRQTLLRLARYVARAAAKTSPYATFTAAGFGRWTEGGPTVEPAPLLVRRSVAELHPFVAERIWRALADRPELRDRVRIRVNPSATEDEGRIWFLGTGPGEPISSVPATNAVRAVLETVRADPRPTHRSDDARRAVAVLMEAGLLERRRPYADQSRDPLGELTRWLPSGHPAAEALRRLDEAVATYPALTRPAERVQRAGEIGEQVRSLCAQEVGGIHSLETALLSGVVTRCGRQRWQPVFDDLGAVRELLGLLDADLPVKLAVSAFFLRRHGPSASVPFLRFYRQVHQEAELGALLRPLPDPAPSPLTGLRRQTWQTLRAAGADAAGVIRIDPDLVRKLAAGWPPYVRPPRSIGCYGQAITTPEGPGLVVNTIACGYGRGLGRLHRLLTRVTDEVPDLGRHRVAENLGAFGTSLNLRPSAGRAIDYPFTTGDDPGALTLTELRVGYEAERELLVLRDADGERVRPMHLGLLNPLLLPPAYSFLVRVFGEPPVALVPGRLLGGAPRGHSPRLNVGRVTLARARWRLPAGEVPTPGKGESEADYVLRFARWLAERGIPRRFFARVLSAESSFTKARKPLYVDAANCFVLLDLARAVGDPGDLVVLEEALPDVAANPCYGDDGIRVTEYLFQVNAGAERP
ncbi:lantibiotic dehydratase [Nonomuraea sp. NPDC026600]|uniref:lantibiotic dehydratase n=1 Tax=Nonomuraea sp. NPDC026600 TaxID=3155363 RepID=UPI0033F2B75F